MQRPFASPAAARRELQRLRQTANEQLVHQHLGFKPPVPYRRSKRLRKLPANFRMDLDHIPVTTGKIMFIRWVPPHGYIAILGESVRVGRRWRFRYGKVMLDTLR